MQSRIRTPVSPGRATSRVNYSLTETAINKLASEKVKESKEYVQQNIKPDILGLRGPQWNESVETRPGRFLYKFSDTVLSNTLLPEQIHLTRVSRSETAGIYQGDRNAQEIVERRANAGSGWNDSVSTEGPLVHNRLTDSITKTSLKCTKEVTKKIPAGAYISPLERQTMISEVMRAQRAAAAAERDAMVQYMDPKLGSTQGGGSFGSSKASLGSSSLASKSVGGGGGSGANAMGSKNSSSEGDGVVRKPARAIRTTKADLEAVRQLDDFVGVVRKSSGAIGEEIDAVDDGGLGEGGGETGEGAGVVEERGSGKR